MNIGKPCRLLYFFKAGALACVTDVVAQRVIEQHGILRNYTDSRAQALLSDGTDILSINENAAFIDIIEPEQQTGECGFACAAGANHGNPVSRWNRKAYCLENRTIRIIGKTDMLKTYLAVANIQWCGIRRILNFRTFLQHIKH